MPVRTRISVLLVTHVGPYRGQDSQVLNLVIQYRIFYPRYQSVSNYYSVHRIVVAYINGIQFMLLEFSIFAFLLSF